MKVRTLSGKVLENAANIPQRIASNDTTDVFEFFRQVASVRIYSIEK